MVLSFGILQLAQAGVIRDTIVTLTLPAHRTAFDYASGTLQILVLIVGLVALSAMALLTITLRKSIVSLQATVDRLSVEVKPLISQATRLSEDVRDVMKTVRGEVDRIADASAQVSERLLDLSDAAETRIYEVNALIDVLQDEVQDTALSAAAAVRGVRVGAVALGAALGLRRGSHAGGKREAAEAAYLEDADDGLDDDGDDDVDPVPIDEPPDDERPYFDADDEDFDDDPLPPDIREQTDTDPRQERPRTSSKQRR